MNERRHEPLAIAVVLAWATVACGSSDAADRTADRAVTDGGIVGSDGSTVLPADGSVTSDGGIVDVLFEGSIHVSGSRDRDDLDGVTRITGDLVVDAPELVVELPILQTVDGSVTLLSEVRLPALRSVGGNLDTDYSVPCPEGAGRQDSLPALVQVGGTFEHGRGGCPVSLPSLTSAGGVTVRHGFVASLSLPALTRGRVSVTDTHIDGVTLPVWSTGSLLVSYSTVGTVDAPAATEVSVSLQNSTVEDVLLPAWESGDLWVENLETRTLSFPALRRSGGIRVVYLYGTTVDSLVESIELPALESTVDLEVDGLPTLSRIDAPRLETFRRIVITGNPELDVFEGGPSMMGVEGIGLAPSLTFEGNPHLSTCAIQDVVDAVSNPSELSFQIDGNDASDCGAVVLP